VALFGGVLIAFVVAPRIGSRMSKPSAPAEAVAVGATFNITPYALRLLDVLPRVGSSALLPVPLCFFVAATACNVTAFIRGASMMADVVEDPEAKTGRRSEGVIFAGSFFVQKCTSGIGIFLAGAILAVAGFPEKATPGQVAVETLDRRTLIYGTAYLLIAGVAAFCFTRFPFGRREHEARLAQLGAETLADSR